VFTILAENGEPVATFTVAVTREALRSFAERQLGREDRLASDSPGSLTLPFSSQEIDEILELSSETVSRTWRALQKDRLIEKSGRQIAIPDLARLEKAARR